MPEFNAFEKLNISKTSSQYVRIIISKKKLKVIGINSTVQRQCTQKCQFITYMNLNFFYDHVVVVV